MKKGFTLVELLAVIVILSIIALITIPVISNVIEKSKKGAIEGTTYGIIEAANLYYSQNVENNIGTKNAQIKKADKKLSYKGNVDDFVVAYNEDGKVALVVYNDEYCGYKAFNSTKVKIGEVENNLCSIEGSIISPDTLLPTTQDLMIWVHNVSKIPTDSGILNEIQIISDLEVSNYVVSSIEPTTKDKGTVWVYIEPKSEYGITMNNIYIPIYGIKQYDGTIWRQVKGYLYNGTEWKIAGEVEYKELILNGADPVLKENLIPVIIEDDGKVLKASLSSTWYSYENKKWANAVILKDESIIYKDNEVIPEANIESYFVWIPRYKYKIFNEGNYTSATGTSASNASITTIDIVFESKDKSVSNGSKKESWLTHPAFTSFNVNGMWVGKFETGYDGATSASTAEIDSSDSNKVIVKPNVYSWRNITVSNMFKASYSYKREMDSHMMKNTEWGAVAYLSHSKYGINKEVNINNNSSFKTGYSALLTTDQTSYKGTYGDSSSYNSSYNTSTGYLASTTGNITGVYDMSGGAYEYVAAYRDTTLGSSGFTSDAISTYNSKYFDVYNSLSSETAYNNRILGDATGEMGPFNNYADNDKNSRYHNSWYADDSLFVDSSNPWFLRSGVYPDGVLAGQFYFDRHTGGAGISVGFRLVLS